ncbi:MULTISPECIES: DNA cytosine methyltransferase [unclassified Microcoleus]|uniref:DNA cytosine methyltransferase n=1 Tax=unclassified Microcoleus TaxID=2642155 RepID=UPI00403F0A49
MLSAVPKSTLPRPPCQAFSQIGKRNCLDDDRGMLLFEIPSLAGVFAPQSNFILTG